MDVYVEKPISNTIEAAQVMVQAARKYNRVVQLGTQQRSGVHFQEAAKFVRDGYIGKVNHVALVQPGSYNQRPQPNTAPPPELDWEMWQGPAPRHPYSPMRRMWRAFYDYGGGLITDWGVHLSDIAMLGMNSDNKGPLLTSCSGQYVNAERDLEQVPDTFSASWQYDGFVMSFSNMVPPSPAFDMQGTWFYGTKGVLHVNRSGYHIIPVTARAMPGGPPPAAPIEGKTVNVKEDYDNDPDTTAHARNFLDCVKSRKRSTSDIEIGFNATLPCLLALKAVKEGKTFAWDGKSAKAV